MTHRPRRRQHQRPGFTLVEMACATVLVGLLGLLCASAWSAFGVPAVDSYRRGRLSREAMMAAASLAADLGGSLPSPSGRLGARDDSRFVGWRTLGGGDLELWFDGDPADGGTTFALPDLAVVYWVADRSLLRWDQATNTTAVVAGDVDSMIVDPDPDSTGQRLRVDLTFRHRDLVRTHTFVASKP